ncbi:hypothetical protein QE152_g21835 [Popillia japonica]|uniref:Uncharacterized protein n=1 Tax=Popillia japonica TaxID=7064 RepID=A0AAW1KKJ3_POPJA
MTIRQASFHFSVRKSTLADRIKQLGGGDVDMKPLMGHFKKTFSEQLESKLVEHLIDLGNKMIPTNKKGFLRFAFELAEYLKTPHQFNKEKKIVGDKFYYEFLSPHPQLWCRKPQSTSIQRAVGFNKPQVDIFFNKYEEMISKLKFTPFKEQSVSTNHK